MDHNFTKQLQEWLATPAAERDNARGALFLLRLSNNKIMYRNIMVNPDAKAEYIEYQIQKYVNFRVQEMTHEEVTAMQQQVEKIAAEHNLEAQKEEAAVTAGSTETASASAFRAGMRSDAR